MKIEEIKTFIKNNKKKIIVGTIIVGGVVITKVILKQQGCKMNISTKEFNFEFETLEEALAKFNELNENMEIGGIALWSRKPDVGFLVQDLS